MTRKLSHSIIFVVLAAGCGSSEPDAPAAAPVTTASPTTPVAALNGSVTVDDVAIYQAVKVSLVTEGKTIAPLELNAPVIANRPAYVRVFVKANKNYRPLIDVQLIVKRAGKPDLILKDGGKRVMPDLDESELAATLNFPIDAADLTADASFSLKVTADTASDALLFPADGTTMSFGAKTGSQVLKVKFVPVSYEADAAVPPIVPDLADINTLRDTLYKMYPVASVDLTVRSAPLKWSTPIEPDGPGWDELLSGIMQLRRVDAVERDVYYVGVFTPKASLEDFCDKGGCILGIAPVATERDISMRAALVLGYQTRSAGGTLAQELAHSMGRYHAPCGNPQSIDGDFPYGGGGIGVMGYDILEKELIAVGTRKDYMSYCGPVWTSDYTFKNVYERMEAITAQQATWGATDAGAPPPTTPSKFVPSFRISADGSVHEGPELEVLDGDGSGEHIDVTYEGANGNVVATGQGLVRRISRTGGSIVIAPPSPIGSARARLHGAGIMGVTQLTSRAKPLAH